MGGKSGSNRFNTNRLALDHVDWGIDRKLSKGGSDGGESDGEAGESHFVRRKVRRDGRGEGGGGRGRKKVGMNEPSRNERYASSNKVSERFQLRSDAAARIGP